MHPDTYKTLALREDTYWWHRARRAMAVALLRRYGMRLGADTLDLGCGPGGNLSIPATFRPSSITGVDISPLALRYAALKAPEIGRAHV